MTESHAYRVPSDAAISEMELKLNFKFPEEYKAFLKSGSDVANAVYEPALVFPGIDRLYLGNVANKAWLHNDVSRDWLPFIEDNGDYFLLNSSGEVRYWSHNGASAESWPSFSDWFLQCCVQRR